MTDDYSKVREQLIERLHCDLVGPEYPDEVIKIKPLQKYLCGILWPIHSSIATDEDDNKGVEGKLTNKEDVESLAPLANALNPSAVGISFLIDKKHPTVKVTVSMGMYKELGEKENWKRYSPNLSDFEINFSKNMKQKNREPILGASNVYIEWLSRPYGDTYAVSMFLVNRNEQETDQHEIDHICVFQPEIKVTGDGTEPFVVRQPFSNNESTYRDEDTRTNDLLYRDETVFAVGHSIAVHWSNISEDKKRAGTLFTKIIPSHEIPMVIPPDWDKGGTLNMRELAQMKTGMEIRQALMPLCNEYEKWINGLKAEAKGIKNLQYRDTANKHIDKCENSLCRMKKGLDLITNDDDSVIFKAFKFANKVMELQRTNIVAAQQGTSRELEEAKWRPFQIAFILQNIEGIVNPLSPDRNLADLLWFPTGGGKTEAYLGLAAFTLGYRRMRESQGLRNDAGVAVIMRYTLRLLTIQQFQRAAAMICACEYIRKQSPNLLGYRPFRIGLWVGDNSVPNKFDDASNIINSIRNAIIGKKVIELDSSKGSPIQLVSCPWCGHPLWDDDSKSVFIRSYKTDRKNRRILINCSNPECDFHSKNSKEGLPVVITDEEIYRLLPDMVIGTVDKFARMPWKPEVQNLFGKIKGEIKDWGFLSNALTKDELESAIKVTGTKTLCNTKQLSPPDLIIQDELHLISGPLGTMVGLYEMAIDYLSSLELEGERIGPKVIASTATIRNADKQIKGLFTREARIFPSPGLSHKDSFFAKQRSIKEVPGRSYVGIFAPGRSLKTALLRVYANQLANTSAMTEEFDDKLLDPYHTLVGYFNSLRELGGAVRLIEDDVPARMKTLEKQSTDSKGNKISKFKYKQREYERNVPELTSRIDSSEIPKILNRLEQPYYKNGSVQPIDILLASNMISVGVDVSRLGLMVVNGQPKTTAEYIQSTSRVGRSYPGLVLTVYNWIRPRDISHYEEFYAYHAALYRYVEPISVTPFASRARDRGLAGSMISMIRLGFPEMTSNSSPSRLINNENISKEIQQVLLNRIKQMNLADEEVMEHLKSIFIEWEDAIERSKLVYSYNRKKDTSNLFYSLGTKKNGSFKVPNSMRDVESSAGIYLRRD